MKYTIDFDMDHVLTDFDKAYQEQYDEKQQFPQADIMFFHDLLPLSGEGEHVEKIDNYVYVFSLIEMGHKVRIVTSPSIKNIGCWTGKAYWIKKYFDEEMLQNLIITYDKSTTCLTGDILVDDGIRNGQLAYGDRLIKFGSDEHPNMRAVYDQIVKWSDEKRNFTIEEKIATYDKYLKDLKE